MNAKHFLTPFFPRPVLSNYIIGDVAVSAIMLMGFADMLNSGLNPEIMLAIDFRGPFCATFWTSKKWKKHALASLYGCAGYGEFICLLRDPDVLAGLKATVGQPLTHEPDLWKLNGIAAAIKAGMPEDDLLIDLEGAQGYTSVFVPGILHSGIFLFKAAQRHSCMPHGKPVLYL